MVLAVLLATPNSVVSRDQLIEAVWAGRPPAAAKTSLYTYLSHLRDQLGSEAIEHVESGYLVTANKDTLDSLEFARLTEEGSRQLSHDPQSAATTFDRALRLWRGPAFGDLGDEPGLLIERAHLTELRLLAEEKRIDAYLELGRHETVLATLSTLVERHPFRERFQAQLMLALYRSGRQAEALRVFAVTRQRFAEELGVDPSPPLWRLEERILSHDPGLLFPPDEGVLAMASRLEPTAARLELTRNSKAIGERQSNSRLQVDASSTKTSSAQAKPRRSGVIAALVGVLLVGGLWGMFTWSHLIRDCLPVTGLTGLWRGDGSTSDAAGGRSAVLSGDAGFAHGLIDEAFLLDGDGDFVYIPHDPGLDVGAEDFTIEMWVNFTSSDTPEQVFAEKWVEKLGEDNRGWTFQSINGDEIALYTSGGGIRSGSLPIQTGEWYHVAAVRRDVSVEVYFEGEIVGGPTKIQSGFAPTLENASSLKFGHRGFPSNTPGSKQPESDGFFFDGRIDDIGYYVGKALTSDEIKAIYLAGTQGKCVDSVIDDA